LNLSLMCKWVEDCADVERGREFTKLDLTSLRIYLHLGHLSAKGRDLNRIPREVTACAGEPSSALLFRPCHQRRRIQGSPIIHKKAAGAQLHLRRGAVQMVRRQRKKGLFEFACGCERSQTGGMRQTTAASADLVGGGISIPLDHCHCCQR